VFQLKHNYFNGQIVEFSYNYWSIYDETGKLILTTKDKKYAEAKLQQLNKALADKISLIAAK